LEKRDPVMTVSVIIPTYNAKNELEALIERLKKQTLPFELVVIDSSSTDGTAEVGQKHADIFLSIDKADFDHGGTRTKAAKAASGEVLVFLTQDALPTHEKTLERLVRLFKIPVIGAAYGNQIPYEHTSLFGRHLRSFNYPETSCIRTAADRPRYGIKTAFLSDSFAAYRRSVLEEIGWFKNGLIVGEDTYAGAKILLKGHALAYCAEARVYHAHSYTVAEEFKRYFDIGVFHEREGWILEHFGKAEGEGRRYIFSELKYLFEHRAPHKIPEFILRNSVKYLGYTLGRHYTALPKGLVKSLSMHKPWWAKQAV